MNKYKPTREFLNSDLSMTGVVAVSPPNADTFTTGCHLHISDCNRKVELHFSTSKKDLKESKKKLKKLKDAIEYIERILENPQ